MLTFVQFDEISKDMLDHALTFVQFDEISKDVLDNMCTQRFFIYAQGVWL